MVLAEAPAAAQRRLARPVVLVGLMGVGKTSVGKRLAARLGVPFQDADEEIERAAGLSIPEIFARYGEPYFRAGERRVLQRLIQPGGRVIATGGGAFMDPETRALALREGVPVWLNADTAVLVERTARRGNRPLLKNGDPAATLKRLAEERNPVYALAPIHVVSGATPHEQAVDAVLTALQSRPEAWA